MLVIISKINLKEIEYMKTVGFIKKMKIIYMEEITLLKNLIEKYKMV